MTIRRRTAGLAALAVLLAGCSGLPGGDGSGDSGNSDGSGGSGVESGGGRPGVDATGKPVAAGTFDTPVAEGAKVEIAVMGLRVRGKLATLTMRLTPRLPATTEQTPNPYELNGRDGLDTALIDPVNLKRYVVVKDSAGNELQTDYITVDTRNNQPSLHTYTFAAPPENVKSLDLQYGSWPTFRNIPVER
ncbi:hypothetical protein [Spirillospora sp. NPDC029432]|uniref:hypothetical protein n=1 Tax=Spirillospora sp. NPDC029432 TaxID=3154599 RepID=UPI0034571A62